MTFADPPQSTDPTPETQPQVSLARGLSTAALVLVSLVLASIFARSAVTSALLFVVILVSLVVAHEAAHFVTAKLFGIHVLEFGIGFPPRIWSKQLGETEYSLNWLPLGGFVRLLGEEDPTAPRSLASKPAWQRLVVLAAGSVMNLLLPIVLFAFAFTVPHEVPTGRAVVAAVSPDSPAAAAGMQTGDIILTVGGRNSQNTIDAGRLIRINTGIDTPIVVRRSNQDVTLHVTPRWAPPAGQGPTGIQIQPQTPFTEVESLMPWQSLPAGLRATADTMILARNEVLSWVKGGTRPQVAGPVAIAQTTGEIAKEGGLSPLLELAALLSINLGILNLLPLPMLDGGRAMFVVIEVLRRGRRIAPEKEAMVHFVGFVLFIALTLVVTFSDITHIVRGDSIFK
jgi:regulator of sigma E protease